MDNKFYGTGRRKTSVARVFIKPGKGLISVNGKKVDDYFRVESHRKSVISPFNVLNVANKMDAYITVKGGGLNGQAQAVRHGLSRALITYDPDYRKDLKECGFLTRDPRMVERKKYGKPKARKSPQYSKR
jgi:small subunit ribosomal protein S9